MGTVVRLSDSSRVSGPRAAKLLGHTVPRRYTPPLVVGAPGPCGCGCALTEATSYGFAVVEFADKVLRAPLDPWQRWVVIHAGEMIRADGLWRPRFRRLILLVARQNGKSHLLVVLALFWLFAQRIPLILGTSNMLDYAKEAMQKAHAMALSAPALEEGLPAKGLRGLTRDNNNPSIRTTNGCRYKVSAATGNAGRSLTVHRWICDETLKHYDWECYKSAYNAMQAVEDAQAWFIGSQGDDRSILLDSLMASALPFAEGKEIDRTGDAVGLFEYSAPERAETDDPEALAQANPNMNRRGLSSLEADAKAAKLAGGAAEAGFRTEAMCIRVKMLDPAVDADAWAAGAGQFTPDKDRRAAVVDLSPDMQHVTLAFARWAPTDKVQVWLRESWDGPDAIKRMRAETPELLRKAGVKRLGYLPIGPGAILFGDLQTEGKSAYRGITIEPITAEMPAMCMGFAEQVGNGEIQHLNQERLNAQVLAVGKKWSAADRWVFERPERAPKDAVNAAAGAVHIARTMPPPLGKVRVIVPRQKD